MDQTVVALLIEPIKHDLGLSDVQIGLATSTAFYVMYGLLSMPMGMLTDRLNRVRLLQLAMALWCGGLALTGLSDSLSLLVASKAITGIGAAISYPAAMSLFSDYFPPERRAFATMSYPIGTVLGGVAATLVGGFSFSALTRAVALNPHLLLGIPVWKVIALIFAVVGLLVIPALMLMREPVRQEVGERTSGPHLGELWAYRHYLIPNLLAVACISGTGNTLSIWIIPSLMRLYGQQPDDFAGWYSIVSFAANVLAMFVGAKLINLARQRGSDRKMMLPAMWSAIIVAPTCCLAIMPNVPLFAMMAALFFFFNGVAIAIPIVSMNFRLPNELRGLAMGMQVLVTSAVGAGISPMVGFVGATIGGEMMIGQAMAIVGVPMALLAALFLWLTSRSGTVSRESII
jgi:MFS family permease